jgi:phosphatidylserine synthase
MDKRNFLGLAASLVAVSIVAAVLFVAGGVTRPIAGLLDISLLVIASVLVVAALVVDSTPLRRIQQPNLLFVPIALMALVSVFSLDGENYASAATTAMVAAMFTIVLVRTRARHRSEAHR